MAFARSSRKDLLKRISPGSPPDLLLRIKILMQGLLGKIGKGFPQDLPRRTCTRSCKDPLNDFRRISTRSSQKDLYKGGFHPDLHKIFA